MARFLARVRGWGAERAYVGRGERGSLFKGWGCTHLSCLRRKGEAKPSQAKREKPTGEREKDISGR